MSENVEAPDQATGRRSAYHDDMLCMPSTSSAAQDVPMERATASYTSHDAKYRITGARSYENQYAQLYYSRLMLLSGGLKARAMAKWPGLACVTTLEVQEGVECIVVGTLYKEMKLKPSVLDEYTKDRGLRAVLLGATVFCSETDGLVLEDGGGRMALQGPALDVQQLVTGIVLALRGAVGEDGTFQASEVCFAGPAPAAVATLPAQPSAHGALDGGDKYVALLSGLTLGAARCDFLRLQLALDFLTGNLGGAQEQRLAGRIVRLVVAGGSLGPQEAAATAAPFSRAHSTAMQPIKDMDMYCAELAAALPVDVMPGAEDPSNVAMPQQPLHRCLFPAASQHGSFHRVPNPHEFDVDGVRFLGTSGQNVDDVAKYSRHASRLSVLEACLRWGHLAPTAPDTLACYPFENEDPFIMGAAPQVLFAGNQPAFDTSLFTGEGGQPVRLVCVPSFARTQTLVLVNLRTLLCHPMHFA